MSKLSLQPPCPEWLPAVLQHGGTEVAQTAPGEPVGLGSEQESETQEVFRAVALSDKLN